MREKYVLKTSGGLILCGICIDRNKIIVGGNKRNILFITKYVESLLDLKPAIIHKRTTSNKILLEYKINDKSGIISKIKKSCKHNNIYVLSGLRTFGRLMR